jgi:hypothetical protein
MARSKQKQKLVVGSWGEIRVPSPEVAEGALDMPEGVTMNDIVRAFIPNPKQPPKPLTEINEIVAWAKKEFDGVVGSYEFIREVPGSLECFQQTVMAFADAADADGQVVPVPETEAESC